MKITIFIAIWIGLMLLLSNKITPDLRGDGEYESGGGVGHPLWRE